MLKKYKKILVTGGAGFIGCHLVKKLVDLKKEVVVIDNLSRGNLANLGSYQKKIIFHQADLRNEVSIKPFFEGVDLVFNLAALNTGVDYDLGRTQIMFEENMLLQMIPLRVAAQIPSIKKFVQISSASVYSRQAMDEQVPTPETADTNNPEKSKLGYALAKKMGENLALWYSQNTRLKTVIARFVNVYGENDHIDELGHFIPVCIKKFLEAKDKVELFGSGQQKRSFIYVSDVVDALLILADKGQNGGIYNVDSNQERSVKEVALAVKNYLHKTVQVIFDTTKPEGSQRRMLDSAKLKALGWQPQVSFEQGLQKTIESLIS